MAGFESFDSIDGPRFRIVGPNGERLCVSDPFDGREGRDSAAALTIRTVVAQHLCTLVPDDGSVIVIKYDQSVASIPSQFMLGWASALRAHIELTHKKRVSVLFAPMGIGLEHFTDNDLASIGLMRIQVAEPTEAE